MPDDCPRDDELQGLFEDHLDAEHAARIRGHVEGCPECGQVLEMMRTTVDTGGADRGTLHGWGALAAQSQPGAAPSDGSTGEEPPSSDLRVGIVVGQGYRLDGLLGRGGMGNVWAATHVGTGERAAIKVLHDPQKRELVRRFLREARATALLEHPSIVRVRGTFELPDGAPALVMELLEGESLRHRLERCSALSIEETAAILCPVLSAVAAAHRAGVVHRDLKPDNIFLLSPAAGATRMEVKVLDFGLVKMLPGEDTRYTVSLTRTGQLLGTPHYMAPEQALGQPVDRRADIWALGVVLYECLSGHKPYSGRDLRRVLLRIASTPPRPLRDLMPALPAELLKLVDRMLQRDPAERLPDLRPVLKLLRRHAPQAAIEEPDEEESLGARLWQRRLPLGIGLALALVALAGAGLAFPPRGCGSQAGGRLDATTTPR